MSRHLQQYREETREMGDEAFLRWCFATFGSGLSFATSLGAEDQVLLHLLDSTVTDLALPTYAVEVFTLDTGRLPEETLTTLSDNRKRFRLPVRVYYPEAREVENLVAKQGINGFYDSLEARKACCGVRKVAPLRRALDGRSAWMTGLRRDQAVTRGGLERVEWDETHGLYKLSPLADWSLDRIWEVIRSEKLPYNALHDRGYPSIGCAPCTRAVKPGEDIRSGRWWWENPEHKECGLHTAPQPGAAKVKIAPLTMNG